jgi:hypothetical protein
MLANVLTWARDEEPKTLADSQLPSSRSAWKLQRLPNDYMPTSGHATSHLPSTRSAWMCRTLVKEGRVICSRIPPHLTREVWRASSECWSLDPEGCVQHPTFIPFRECQVLKSARLPLSGPVCRLIIFLFSRGWNEASRSGLAAWKFKAHGR